MATQIDVSFPGKLKVEAKVGDFVLLTDQQVDSGGDGSGPTPFELFGASIITCTGFVAAEFCRTRDIDTAGMGLKLEFEKDLKSGRYPKMSITVQLPNSFPEKYRKAITSAMDQCTVKKHILEPPEFDVVVV